MICCNAVGKGNVHIEQGDCLDLLHTLQDESIDLIVTSPPYDNLRTYNGNIEQWNFEKFTQIAKELYRVVKQGGVVVWVVADATVKGSETGTSFRQALYFMDCGFNLHDTMIYKKLNYTPLNHKRYEQEFEYMFVFSKGSPKTFNPIRIPCKYAGSETWGKSSYYKTNDGNLVQGDKKIIGETKIKGNIFEYRTGSTQTGKIKHPAMFPEKLAKDHILSWSNEGDIVLDCFMGSGTTGVACIDTNRKFIGYELDEEYFNIAKQRLSDHKYVESIYNKVSNKRQLIEEWE